MTMQTEHKPQGYSMSDIQSANARAGSHCFDPEAIRFVRRRIGPTVYKGPGGVFFISSEQFVPSVGPAAERKYTVRVFVPRTGKVDTADEEFNARSYSSAVSHAKKLAAGEATCYCSACRHGKGHIDEGKDLPCLR